VASPKRVFPFDSGAFSKRKLPDYIGLMPRREFEVNGADAPERIIGSFFGSTQDYFFLKAKPINVFEQEFSLSPFNAEAKAIMRLAGEKSIPEFDDRRFAFEVQSAEPVEFLVSKPLAVVLPEQYLDIEIVRNTIQDDWGAEPWGYPMFALSVSAYYAIIYKEVHSFYERRELL